MLRYLLLTIFLLGGCAPQAAKFKRDAKFGKLKPNCRGLVANDTCNRTQTIKEGVKVMTQLHEAQRAQWAKKLAYLRVMLTTPEKFPISSVELKTDDPNNWKSLNMAYPVFAVLRLEYLAGKDRHQFGGALMKAMDEMKTLADTQREQWTRTEKPFNGPLDLGPKVSSERVQTRLNMTVASAKYSKKVNIPADLAEKFLSGLDDVQHIDLAMIYDEGALKRRFLANEWLSVKPAFSIAGGKKGWAITETSAERSKNEYPFDVGSMHFCQSLRGEVRHLQRGERPKVSWKTKPRTEGEK